jgi:hypothetical protein
MAHTDSIQDQHHPAPDEHADPAHIPPRLKPATNVHPAVAVIGAACYAWIMLMSWRAFDHGTTMLDLVISTLIFAMIIGLWLQCAAMARNVTPDRRTTRDFGAFLEGQVDTYTGSMPGWQAMMEILLPPVALALGATAFCIIAQAYSF